MSTLSSYLAVCRRLKELRDDHNRDYDVPRKGCRAAWDALKKEQAELHAKLFSGKAKAADSSPTKKKLRALEHKATATPPDRYGIGTIPLYD